MTHGVVRVSGRGVPKSVLQKEESRKVEQERVRHTVKAAVVKGDSVCSDLVCVSLYDTKPVYILTNACDEIKWVKKERKVWDKNLNRYKKGYFHRLNVIDFYNKNMGNVDLADQLRNYYRYDTQWHRNRKWWWAIFWWGFQLALTNSYILYRKYHELHLSTSALTHYEYIKQVALAWMDNRRYGPYATVNDANDDDSSRVSVRTKKRKSNTIDLYDSSSEEETLSSRKSTRSTNEPTFQYSMTSSATSGSTPPRKVKKNARINDAALNPAAGSLWCRLDAFMSHCPMHFEGKRAGKCQLH